MVEDFNPYWHEWIVFSDKINKKTVDSNDKLDQMDLTDIYRVFPPKAAEYAFF